MIAWIDLETTGLNTECSIIEVACVVTDDKFNEVGRYESLCMPDPWGAIEGVAREMHDKSGLWDQAIACDKTFYQVDRELVDVLMYHAAVKKDTAFILGGQSVHFDRRFIERWMPQTNTMLAHRQIDVSGLKLMWSMALDIPTEALPPERSKTTHRAMDDILASIEAARWYQTYITGENPCQQVWTESLATA